MYDYNREKGWNTELGQFSPVSLISCIFLSLLLISAKIHASINYLLLFTVKPVIARLCPTKQIHTICSDVRA